MSYHVSSVGRVRLSARRFAQSVRITASASSSACSCRFALLIGLERRAGALGRALGCALGCALGRALGRAVGGALGGARSGGGAAEVEAGEIEIT